jgi:prophage regulatory protein
MQSNPVTSKHLLSKRAVLKQIPISGATLARRVAAGAFPRPIRIGKRRVAWVQSEVSDWLAERMKERCQGPTEPAISTDVQRKVE